MSRKYRQRGYMDDGGEAPARRPQGPRERPEGPRGRGLGRPTETAFRCSRCGTPRALEEPVGVEASCAKCGADLHSCTNCRHFDTSARFECREPIAERIAAKAGRNECDRFEPKLVQGFAAEGGGRDDPRAAFDSLFDF